MKKSVIVLIAVIYIVAIATVSFIGLKVETFNETVYVNKIEITNENLKYAEDGSKYIVIKYVNDEDNPTAYQIEWHVYPDEASRKLVEFVYDETNEIATVNAIGTVVFKRKGAITVYVSATDGSSISDKITIYAK